MDTTTRPASADGAAERLDQSPVDRPADRVADRAQDRTALILDAAEICFARTGYHRATMQDIAAQAQMSAGNLYRYFKSKDAIMEGLADRDRGRVAADFAMLQEQDDFMEALRLIGEKHFRDEPREKAIVCLEIWAEATRNPNFQRINEEFQRDLVAHMAKGFDQARAKGEIGSHISSRDLAGFASLLADGLFVRRALRRDYNPERDVKFVLSIIGALLSGKLDAAISLGEDAAVQTREGVSQ